MGKVIGIDLGTTNSVISIVTGEDARVIPNGQGNLTTPSVVAYANDTILVGEPAKNQAVTNPTKTVASVKRIIGQRFEEKSVAEFKKTVPYPVVGKRGEAAKVKIEDVELLPQEISALVLRELKQCAEENLEEVVTDVVITVPAYFNDSQRQATKDAGAIAGLNVKRIINEPTAAALAYGFKETGDEATIAVFDLGGGTFDISVLEIGGGILEVKSTNGNTYLGGDDFDQVITKFLIHKFKKDTGIDLSADITALSRLREASEKAKCRLSEALTTTVTLPFVASNAEGPVHLNIDITRAQFEALIKPFMLEVEKCCKKALEDAELSAKEIDNVILVGGSTRVPLVRDLVRKIFGREPDTSVNPDEVVARGAAIQGAIITGEETRMVLLDVTPLSLGIETSDEEMDVLIPRNTTIPVSVTEIYSTQEDDQEIVDVVVYQGEHQRASRNRLLGQFELGGIEPADAGDPQIEVRFDIDVNGILTVSAKDMDTGAERSVRIENSSKLSEDQISKMQQDAEQHQEEDRQYVAIKQMQLDAESFLEQTEVGLQEFTDLLNAEEMEGLEFAHRQLKAAYETEPVNTATLQAAINDMNAIWKYILEKQEG